MLLASGRPVASPMKQLALAVDEDEVTDVEPDVMEIGPTNMCGKGDALRPTSEEIESP